MISHKVSNVFAGFFMALLLFGNGQAAGEELDLSTLADARSQLQAETRKIVREELRLTDNEAKAFWPIYDKFRGEMKNVRDRQVELISDYMRAYNADQLTDKLANRILKDHLSIERDMLDVKKKYIRQFRKALPVKKVTRFYQLENKLNAAVDIQLAETIPLFDAF